MSKKCRKCDNTVPSTIVVDGKKRNLANRVHCFSCSPFRAGSNSRPIAFFPSPQRTWDEENFIQAVSSNTTVSGILRSLGLSTSPGNYKTVKRYCERLGLSTSHLTGKAEPFRGNSRPLEQVLVKDSDYVSNSNLRKRLIKAGILEERCYECGNGPTWNGKPLIFHLDHINGIPDDNRRENLRLLCPNCHSQTETYSNRWKGAGRYSRSPVVRNRCCDCDNPIDKAALRCTGCHALKQRKIEWPPAEELEREVIATSYLSTARRLGVTDNAVRKHLKRTLDRERRRP